MKRCVAAGVLATGCLSIPAYQPETSVSYIEDGTGGTAIGPGLALRFAAGSGFHLPDQLVIDGADVLGRDPDAVCFDQDEAGLLISPTDRISAHGGAVALRNQLAAVLRGPAVTQVTLDWATGFGCNPDRKPVGSSTFTMFPDRRIVRHDVLADSSNSAISASACACVPDSRGFTVTAYWTLARAAFRDFYVPTLRGLPAPTETLANQHAACLDAGSFQVAFGWPVSVERTSIRGGTALIGFGQDLVIGASNLDDLDWKTSAAMFVGRAGCAAELKRAADYATPPALAINGEAWTPSERDGIYGGDGGNTGDQPPGIPLATDHVELSGGVGSSFAVWLRFPRPVADLRATGGRAPGAWYLPQQVNDREWIVWFRDSISANQTIVIEPR